MDDNLFVAISRAKPINIFHLEDDPQYFEILEDNVLEDFKYHYAIHKCASLTELAESLQKHQDFPIVILDLNLGKPRENFDGLAWAIKNVRQLKVHDVAVFVWSGMLNATSHILLENIDVKEEFIINKGDIDDDDYGNFRRLLENAAHSFLEYYSNKLKSLHKESVFAFGVKILNSNPINGVFEFIEKEPYVIEVEVTTLPFVLNRPHLIGQELKIYIQGIDCETSPRIASLPIMGEVYTTSKIEFEVLFSNESGLNPRSLSIAIFYGNNPLRMYDFRVHINSLVEILSQQRIIEPLYLT